MKLILGRSLQPRANAARTGHGNSRPGPTMVGEMMSPNKLHEPPPSPGT